MTEELSKVSDTNVAGGSSSIAALSDGMALLEPEISQKILQIMPHRTPMVFIDRVVALGEGRVLCESEIRDDHILFRNGAVSAVAIVEIFAQSAAALIAAGLLKDPNARMAGALLGARNLFWSVETLELGKTYQCRAVDNWGAGALRQLECELFCDGESVAKGAINVVATGDIPTG